MRSSDSVRLSHVYGFATLAVWQLALAPSQHAYTARMHAPSIIGNATFTHGVASLQAGTTSPVSTCCATLWTLLSTSTLQRSTTAATVAHTLLVSSNPNSNMVPHNPVPSDWECAVTCVSVCTQDRRQLLINVHESLTVQPSSYISQLAARSAWNLRGDHAAGQLAQNTSTGRHGMMGSCRLTSYVTYACMHSQLSICCCCCCCCCCCHAVQGLCHGARPATRPHPSRSQETQRSYSLCCLHRPSAS